VFQSDIAEHLLKPPILEFKVIQGHRHQYYEDSSSAVFVTIRSKSVPICNCFYARGVNNGIIAIVYGGTLFGTLSREIISSSGTEFAHKNLRH